MVSLAKTRRNGEHVHAYYTGPFFLGRVSSFDFPTVSVSSSTEKRPRNGVSKHVSMVELTSYFSVGKHVVTDGRSSPLLVCPHRSHVCISSDKHNSHKQRRGGEVGKGRNCLRKKLIWPRWRKREETEKTRTRTIQAQVQAQVQVELTSYVCEHFTVGKPVAANGPCTIVSRRPFHGDPVSFRSIPRS